MRLQLQQPAYLPRTAALIVVLLGMAVLAVEASRGVADEPDTKNAPDRFFVYVSVAGENRLSLYQMMPESGRLIPNGSVELSGSPGSLAVDPGQKFLYAAIRGAHSVASFSMDADTGGLTPLGMVPVAGDPVYVSTDRSGKYLLTAYYSGDKAAIYPIRNDGSIARHATQVLELKRKPHSIGVDRSNRFVFIPNAGADLIQQFLLDAESGQLSPNAVPIVKTPAGAAPRHFFFHPQKTDILYVINEQNSSVTTYQLDTSTGRLAPLQTVSTLPADFHGRNTCADVEVTPSGKYLYGSNRGHDSIAEFSIDAATGLLTPLGQAPTEKTPREFNIDPTGRYLFSAGQDSGRMVSYRIVPETGRLERLDVYDVGTSPAWVLILRQPQPLR